MQIYSPDSAPPRFARLRRACGIAFGVATHVLFGVTVYHLFRFLHADTVHPPRGSMWTDACLALQFSVLHSALLHPRVRRRLSPWVPAPFYGCFFCCVTCVQLLALFAAWKSDPWVLWRLQGVPHGVIAGAFYVSWGALFYSLYLSGLGYQTGLNPWWSWVRGQPLPQRPFRPTSLFWVLRHPVYLSFMGLVWFNPVMTLDRLLLAGIWSAYIFVGSYLKDERLAFYLGDAYRRYQERVPGYPLMPFGPLARRQPAPEPPTVPDALPSPRRQAA